MTSCIYSGSALVPVELLDFFVFNRLCFPLSVLSFFSFPLFSLLFSFGKNSCQVGFDIDFFFFEIVAGQEVADLSGEGS